MKTELASLVAFVAQSCTLLSRRIAFGWLSAPSSGFRVFEPLRIANPRYGRLKICATVLVTLLLFAATSLRAQTNSNTTPGSTGTVARRGPPTLSEIDSAAMRGDVERIKTLLAANPDYASTKDEHGWTPLYWAAASGRKEVVELLLANKADINAFNNGFTPLHAAILNHHPDVADMLIASNAQVTIFDAAGGGYVEILKAELKADPTSVSATNGDGWHPLQFAARNGRLDAVKLLLANKADVNAGDRHGMTALEAALAFSGSAATGARSADTNHEAIAELLLANGAKVVESPRAITALHYAASAGFTNVVAEILDRGANINAKDFSGRTAVDFAAQRGHMEVVNLLVARGAEISDTDKAGIAALNNVEKKPQTRAASAYEYEVDGNVNQTMNEYRVTNHASASFTVFVRDCGWMIKTVETNETGGIVGREIGSTNGAEIFEISGAPDGSGIGLAEISSNNIPIGELDAAVVGHVWLMFASKCYWPALKSDSLTPIYDWRASPGASPLANRQKLSADWELLDGPSSLPREVRYLDAMNHTNAIYTITSTNSVGGMLFPAGFVFKQFNGDRLIKHVEVEVTAIRPVCSRANLIPLPSKGTQVIDNRFDSGVPNRPSQYQNPVFGQWLSAEESKKLAGINTSNTLRNLARSGIPAFPETHRNMQTISTNAPVLSVSLRCTNDVVKAGDEIDIEFRITNRGTNDYIYSDRTYDRSGRMPEYALVATNGAGKAVPNAFKPGGFGGGLSQYATIKPGESFTKVISLNDWALVKDPGRYYVTGTYYAEVSSNNPAAGSVPTLISIPTVSDAVEINVLPRMQEEFEAYISGLTNQIAALTSTQTIPHDSHSPKFVEQSPQLDQLLKRLAYTCSPRIVPTVLNAMYLPGHAGFWEYQALVSYVPHTDEIGKAIITTATERGMAPNMQYIIREYGFTNKADLKPLIARWLAVDNPDSWASGASLAREFGDDAFTERLIAIAKTPRSSGRSAAISALAAHRTDEGVRAFKSLLDDPHENVWAALANGLENGFDRGIFNTNDFTAGDLKPLINRTLRAGSRSPDIITGVNFLEQFYDDEFTPRLISIANDTDNFAWQSAVYALAYNRTDAGVNALKSLLNSSNPEVRSVAARAVRYAYTERGNIRGRPLQPGDFDQEYQKPLPKN